MHPLLRDTPRNKSTAIPAAKGPFTPQREMISKLWGADAPAKAARQIRATLFD
jgi:hypothetical protein